MKRGRRGARFGHGPRSPPSSVRGAPVDAKTALASPLPHAHGADGSTPRRHPDVNRRVLVLVDHRRARRVVHWERERGERGGLERRVELERRYQREQRDRGELRERHVGKRNGQRPRLGMRGQRHDVPLPRPSVDRLLPFSLWRIRVLLGGAVRRKRRRHREGVRVHDGEPVHAVEPVRVARCTVPVTSVLVSG